MSRTIETLRRIHDACGAAGVATDGLASCCGTPQKVRCAAGDAWASADERPKASARFLNLDDQSLLAYRQLFRSVRTTLATNEPQCISLTSAEPGDGKTTTAVNLAFAAAEQERVIVIDANLTRPKAAKRLAAPSQPGLAEVLVDGLLPDAAIRLVCSAGYAVLPSGRRTASHAELLASRRMTVVLRNLKQQYDLIILDGPPVKDFNAVTALARNAAASFLVVQAHKTCRKSADRALTALARAGVKIDGCILTARGGLAALTEFAEIAEIEAEEPAAVNADPGSDDGILIIDDGSLRSPDNLLREDGARQTPPRGPISYRRLFSKARKCEPCE